MNNLHVLKLHWSKKSLLFSNSAIEETKILEAKTDKPQHRVLRYCAKIVGKWCNIKASRKDSWILHTSKSSYL